MEVRQLSKRQGPASLKEGTRIGPWRVVAWRGQGSYGAVYLVVRPGEEPPVPFALKMALRPDDPRFEREAELLWRSQHPNIPRFHGAGVYECEQGRFPFVVMEWIEGVALYEWSRQHNPTSRQVLRMLAHLAGALAVVQAAGGVHRDVKGDNVLVRRADGKPYLMDLGSGWVNGLAKLTLDIFAPGTAQYRSPEAWAYQRFSCFFPQAHYEGSGRDDLFSLGMLAYRLVTDEYPPPTRLGEDGAEVWLTGRGPRPPRLLNDRVCRELDAIIARLVAVAPMDRYEGSCLRAAVALERAAKSAGPEADEPLFAWETQHASQPPPEKGLVRWPVEHGLRRRDPEAVRRSEERDAASHVELERQEVAEQQRAQALTEKEGPRFAVARWALGAALAAVLVVAVVMPQRQEAPQQPWEVPSVARAEPRQQEEGRDGGPSGLGDEVSATSVTEAKEEIRLSEPLGFTKEVPKTPLAGQRRPPCKPRQIEIRGGCWYEAGHVEPPCEDGSYEWAKNCYVPIFSSQREPTSDEP